VAQRLPIGQTRDSLAEVARDFQPGLVSVIIPCFNAERYLREAIDSALAQTYPQVEVVVIDDGSSDSSARIMREYGERITCRSGPNAGACSARNDGVSISTGEFIQFLDADDVLVPDAVEQRMAAFTQGAGMVFGDRVHVDDVGHKLAYESPHPDRGWDEVGFAQYVIITNIHTMEPLHRRRWVCEVGGFDEALPQGQEPDFHLRLTLAGCPFAYSPGIVGGFRQHASMQRIGSSTWWRTDPERYMRFARHYMILVTQRSADGLTPEFSRAMAGMLCFHSVELAARGELALARRYHDELIRLLPGFRPHGLAGVAADVFGLWRSIRVGGWARRFGTSR